MIYSLGSLAWDIWLGNFSLATLATLAWELWLRILSLGSQVWDLRLRELGSGDWGNRLPVLGEPSGPVCQHGFNSPGLCPRVRDMGPGSGQ